MCFGGKARFAMLWVCISVLFFCQRPEANTHYCNCHCLALASKQIANTLWNGALVEDERNRVSIQSGPFWPSFLHKTLEIPFKTFHKA